MDDDLRDIAVFFFKMMVMFTLIVLLSTFNLIGCPVHLIDRSCNMQNMFLSILIVVVSFTVVEKFIFRRRR